MPVGMVMRMWFEHWLNWVLIFKRKMMGTLKSFLVLHISMNVRDWTSLLIASERGHESVVRVLVELGADIDAKDNE